tara:strand:+ start:36 stop:443 length:408 start_codon:yes stop_codon:yes gene_type:complete
MLNSVGEERTFTKDFFESTRMPSYDDTIKIINSRENSIDVFSEWGEYNWKLFRTIWNKDFIHKIKVRSVAEQVVKGGDFTTLQNNFYAMLWITQDVASKMPYSTDMRRTLNSLVATYMKLAFDGVTDSSGDVWRN